MTAHRRTDGPTAGQQRAIAAFVGGPTARTYGEAAAEAGVSVNTLKTQLRRVRQNWPAMWAAVQQRRSEQLAVRHRDALARAEAHSGGWFRRQFYRTWGYWPREHRARR